MDLGVLNVKICYMPVLFEENRPFVNAYSSVRMRSYMHLYLQILASVEGVSFPV